MKIKSKIRPLIGAMLVSLILVSVNSCRDEFEDINTNPLGFTQATSGSLFNSTVKSLMLGWNEQFYIYNEVLYKQTQLGALGSEAWGNISLGTEELWTNYYTTLANIRELEYRFETADSSAELNNMKAMVKILLAYKTFKMTDLFGDMPFFDAGRGFEDLSYLRPAFDSQRDIYLYLMDDLQSACELLNDEGLDDPFMTFASFDNLFHGSIDKWRKFANSIRLKQAVKMYNKEPELAGNIIRDILENDLPLIQSYDFITFVNENVYLKPSELGFTNDAASWSFREHKNLRMGSNMWHLLSDHDSTDGSGIFDVRAYYFFETNNANDWVAYPQIPGPETPAIGGMPYMTHRDLNFSIKGDLCIYSPFNYFLVRDGDNIPELLISGADIHYTKAEIYFRGLGVPVNKSQAEVEYMQGLEGSVKYWTETMAGSTLPLNHNADFFSWITVPSQLNYTYLLNKVALWNLSTDEEKLTMIYTQQYINLFRQVWDAFSLCRRVDLVPREGDPLSYYRLPYPPSESEYNTQNLEDAISAGNAQTDKIWWNQ